MCSDINCVIIQWHLRGLSVAMHVLTSSSLLVSLQRCTSFWCARQWHPRGQAFLVTILQNNLNLSSHPWAHSAPFESLLVLYLLSPNIQLPTHAEKGASGRLPDGPREGGGSWYHVSQKHLINTLLDIYCPVKTAFQLPIRLFHLFL